MSRTRKRGSRGAQSRDVTIVNQRGLHARAAARFAQCAQAFEAEVTVTANGLTVAGDSIMELMMLAAGPGTAIRIDARGASASDALNALTGLVAARFDEEI